jgi:hypothetical protein
MKKIVFGLQLDHKIPPVGMGGEGIDYFFGPQQFTVWLEKRCGIKQPEESQETLRIEIYRQHLTTYLQSFPEAFFGKSFYADPFATAKTLLHLRDDLILSGWSRRSDAQTPERLATLSQLENILLENISWPKGWADRQNFLLSRLPFKGTQNITIYFIEPPDLWPSYWQRVFSLLEEGGAQWKQIPSFPTADESSDLGIFQRFIQEGSQGQTTKVSGKGDGSLCILTGKRDTELASWFAKWINENKTWFPILLLPDKTRTIDHALISEGLPSLGLQTRSDARPLLQLLKLVPEFLWQPIDPIKLLAFLTLPLQPFPRQLAKKLASILAKKPGLFGLEWQEILLLTEKQETAEDWQIIKKEYDFWFLRKRYSLKESVPKKDLVELFTHMYIWSQGEIKDHESKLSIGNQTQTILKLLENLPETSLSHLEITRLMRTALEPIARSPFQAQKNHLKVTHHATAILEPVDDLIWWTFTEKEKDYFFSRWYADELHYLQEEGVYPDLPAKENRRLSWYRKQAFLKTKKRLFLFLPDRVEGAEIQPFPLFGDLNACFESLLPLQISLDVHLKNTPPPSSVALLSGFNLPPIQMIQGSYPENSPLFLELKQINELPERAEESFTSLESLFYYPYKWAFKYPLGLYPSESLQMVDDKRLFGNLAHRLFEQLFMNTSYWSENESFIQQWLMNSIPPLLEQEGATLLLYGKEPERVSLIKKLSHALITFIRLMKRSGWEPEAVEKKLSGRFCDLDITGYADLILQRGNERAIIDMKWSGKSYRTDLLKNKEDLQLALYHSLLNQNGNYDQIYTGFYIIESALLLSRNPEAFSEASRIESSENPAMTYAGILQKMSQTHQWRKKQLADGLIELRNKENSKLLEEYYGAVLLDLLEMKKEDSKFDDFKTLVTLPN